MESSPSETLKKEIKNSPGLKNLFSKFFKLKKEKKMPMFNNFLLPCHFRIEIQRYHYVETWFLKLIFNILCFCYENDNWKGHSTLRLLDVT